MFEVADRGFGRATCRSVAMGPEAAAPYRRLSDRVLERWSAAEHARVELLQAIAEWDDADASVIDGTAPEHWLRHRMATTAGEARRLLTLARGLAAHEVIAAALSDGAITTAKAEIILGAFTPAREVYAVRDAGMLVEHAARHSCSGLRRIVRFWAAKADAAAAWHDAQDRPEGGPDDGAVDDPADGSSAGGQPGGGGGCGVGPETGSGTLHLAATFEEITELQATLMPEAGAVVDAALELAMAEERRRRRAALGLPDTPGDDEATHEATHEATMRTSTGSRDRRMSGPRRSAAPMRS